MRELTEVAVRLRQSTSVHAVVLTAVGRNFSAGADMTPGEILQPDDKSLLETKAGGPPGPRHVRRLGVFGAGHHRGD